MRCARTILGALGFDGIEAQFIVLRLFMSWVYVQSLVPSGITKCGFTVANIVPDAQFVGSSQSGFEITAEFALWSDNRAMIPNFILQEGDQLAANIGVGCSYLPFWMVMMSASTIVMRGLMVGISDSSLFLPFVWRSTMGTSVDWPVQYRRHVHIHRE